MKSMDLPPINLLQVRFDISDFREKSYRHFLKSLIMGGFNEEISLSELQKLHNYFRIIQIIRFRITSRFSVN